MRNESGSDRGSVVISAEFYDGSNKRIFLLQDFTHLKDLRQGEKSAFEMTLQDSSRIEKAARISVTATYCVPTPYKVPCLVLKLGTPYMDARGLYHQPGELVNEGAKNATLAMVSAAFYGAGGKIVDVGAGFVRSGEALEPGHSERFDITVAARSAIEWTSVNAQSQEYFVSLMSGLLEPSKPAAGGDDDKSPRVIVYVDKPRYPDGDVMVVGGSVENMAPDIRFITLRVEDMRGVMFTSETVPLDPSGFYRKKIEFFGRPDLGDAMRVVASYAGAASASTTFAYAPGEPGQSDISSNRPLEVLLVSVESPAGEQVSTVGRGKPVLLTAVVRNAGPLPADGLSVIVVVKDAKGGGGRVLDASIFKMGLDSGEEAAFSSLWMPAQRGFFDVQAYVLSEKGKPMSETATPALRVR